MSLNDFIATLEDDRKALRHAISDLSLHELQTDAVTGIWTIKDLLGHIAAWEREAARAIDQVLDGSRPDLQDILDYDVWNDKHALTWQDLTTSQVLEELDASRANLLDHLRNLGDDRFEDPHAFAATEGTSIRQLLDWQHDRSHTADIETWRLNFRSGQRGSTHMRLGAHMSVAGGVSNAPQRGHSIGCDAIQLFTRNQRQWRSKPPSPDEIDRYKLSVSETGIQPIVAHNSYLINLASPDPVMWEKSLQAYVLELGICQTLGIRYLVMHPGSHVGSGEEAGLSQVALALDKAYELAASSEVVTLLETTAGQGTSLGHRFEHLASIRDAAASADRIAVCFDSAHVFAAGYDLRSAETYEETMTRFADTIGLELLKCFHLNDSKRPLGSRVDRHEHIGQGEIGLEFFRVLINDERFAGQPGLLETPKGPELREDVENLRLLRSLVEA